MQSERNNLTMNKHISYLICLFLSTIVLSARSSLRLIPAFETCSYYLSDIGGDSVIIHYRQKNNIEWQEAYPPFYDSAKNEYRGSLVRLTPACTYEINCICGKDTVSSEFTTWSDYTPIARHIKLSSVKKQSDGHILLSGIHGSESGWIAIDCKHPFNYTGEADVALFIDDCSYLIFNNLVITGGQRHAIKTGKHAENIRFINCDISHWGRVPATQDSVGHYLDSLGQPINNDAGICIYKSRNIVIERSYIHDSNGKTNTWNGTIELGEFAGREYTFSHPQGPNAIYVMQARGGIVIRHNDLVGSQLHRYNDPIEAWQNRDIDGGLACDADVYGNMIAFGQDDGIELDGGQCNVRLFDNRIEQVYCGISTAPNRKGPSYIFNNLLWNMSNSLGNTGNAVKNGGGDTFTQGRQYLFHNTIVHTGGGVAGVGYGKDSNRELFIATLRNNIILSLRSDKSSERKGFCIYDPHLNSACDFDYDYLGNICNRSSRGTIHAYEGAEQHAMYGRPAFNNMQQAVFTLDQRDKNIGKGVYLPGFSRNTNHPTAGAFEYGASSLTPQRPVDWEADKYCVTLIDEQEQHVKISIGKIACKQFTIRMAEDMQPWLEIKTKARKLKANSELIITFKKKKTKTPYHQTGIVFVRLSNGYSLPITVNTPML